MIPKSEKFLDIQPISGTIDEVLENSKYVDVDYVYSDDHSINEVMSEYDVTREEAITMLEEAKLVMIKQALDELVKKGDVIKCGINNQGETLYRSVKKKKTKKKNK